MTTALKTQRDLNGNPTTGFNSGNIPSDTCQFFTLTANVVTTVTVPSPTFNSKLFARFTFGVATGNVMVWVLPASAPTLALPSGTVTATIAELNPLPMIVNPGQTLQFLTSESGVAVSIVYFEVS